MERSGLHPDRVNILAKCYSLWPNEERQCRYYYVTRLINWQVVPQELSNTNNKYIFK